MGCIAEIIYGTVECNGNCDNCHWWDKPQESEVQDADSNFEIVTRGNCIMCGKELDEGLFFCKECEAKAESEDKK